MAVAGVTVTVTGAELAVQLLALVAVTVYVVVLAGLAVTLALVLLLSPVVGDQLKLVFAGADVKKMIFARFSDTDAGAVAVKHWVLAPVLQATVFVPMVGVKSVCALRFGVVLV
jgi:hypothetical protein